MDSAEAMNTRRLTHAKICPLLLLAIATVVAPAGCHKKKPVRRVTDGMTQITAGKDTFYIDRFEYPNRAGERPRVAVSWEQAHTACGEAGKGPGKPAIPADDKSQYEEPPVIKPGSGPSWSPPTNKWELKRKGAPHPSEGAEPKELAEPPPLPPEGDPRVPEQASGKK